MSTRRWLPAMAVLLLASTLVLAENRQVNCDHGESLATALEKATPRETIQISGTCQAAIPAHSLAVSLLVGACMICERFAALREPDAG